MPRKMLLPQDFPKHGVSVGTPWWQSREITSPLDIAGLQLWLDAESLGLADGTAVSSWTDKSGLGRHATQADVNKQPKYFTKRNLLTANQASLETDTTGWTAETNCTISSSATVALYGTRSLAVTASGVGATSAIVDNTMRVPVQAGTTYTALASFRAATIGRNCRLYIYWYDAAGLFVGSSSSAIAADALGTWTPFSVTAPAPVGAVSARVRAAVNDTLMPATETHYVDGISLHEGTSTVYRHPTSITKPVLQFDGIDDVLMVADNAALEMDTDSTVFFVLQPITGRASGLNALLSKDAAASAAGAYYLHLTLTLFPSVDRPFVEAGVAGSAAYAAHTPAITTAQINGTAVNHFKNGTANGTDTLAVGTATNQPLRVGAFWSTAERDWWVFHATEVIIYNRALSTDERKGVEKLLGLKYGITVAP